MVGIGYHTEKWNCIENCWKIDINNLQYYRGRYKKEIAFIVRNYNIEKK
jgi:hypothetical protein